MSMYECPRVYNIGQNTFATCWRTCYEIMLRHKIKDPKDAHKLPGQARMEANGMMDSDFAICAKKLGLGGIRYTYFQDLEKFEHALRCWGPVWVSGFFLDGHKHVVVVKGIDVEAKRLLVNDPWRAYSGGKAKSEQWSFSRFTKRINPVSWSCQLWY